jgi:hypothetical protein
MNRRRGGGEETINIDNGNRDRGTYTGNLVNGKRDGQGKMKYENGDVYDGSWENEEKYHDGEMKYKNGDVYNGNWWRDKMNGKGEMNYKNGDVYNGNWSQDKINGEGQMKYENGDVYNGEWHKGKKDEWGKMKYNKDGSVYNGWWFDDERGIGKTYKKNVSKSYKTAIDYTYYTVQKPSDLIIGKTYLLYSPEDKKREIAVFVKEIVEYEITGYNETEDENEEENEEQVYRYSQFIFHPKKGSKIEKIMIYGKEFKEKFDGERSKESHFDHIDLEFSPINQVLLFKDENPFYNRETKRIPTGPYKDTLDYMYDGRGGKTNKRKNKVMGLGKKRKTQRYRTL